MQWLKGTSWSDTRLHKKKPCDFFGRGGRNIAEREWAFENRYTNTAGIGTGMGKVIILLIVLILILIILPMNMTTTNNSSIIIRVLIIITSKRIVNNGNNRSMYLTDLLPAPAHRNKYTHNVHMALINPPFCFCLLCARSSSQLRSLQDMGKPHRFDVEKFAQASSHKKLYKEIAL